MAVLEDRYVVIDERDARRTLREQIARLEAELVTASQTCRAPVNARGSQAGPRLLSLGELERVRDELAGRVSDFKRQIATAAERQAEARLTLERMLLEPGHYKWRRISANDIGETGCKHWHVRPRLGIVGMLAGWWHVKVSSGCPLAWGPWLRRRSLPPNG